MFSLNIFIGIHLSLSISHVRFSKKQQKPLRQGLRHHRCPVAMRFARFRKYLAGDVRSKTGSCTCFCCLINKTTTKEQHSYSKNG